MFAVMPRSEQSSLLENLFLSRSLFRRFLRPLFRILHLRPSIPGKTRNRRRVKLVLLPSMYVLCVCTTNNMPVKWLSCTFWIGLDVVISIWSTQHDTYIGERNPRKPNITNPTLRQGFVMYRHMNVLLRPFRFYWVCVCCISCYIFRRLLFFTNTVSETYSVNHVTNITGIERKT